MCEYCNETSRKDKTDFATHQENEWISNEEYQSRRVSPLLSVGEANQKGNRKFKINQDLHSISLYPQIAHQSV